MYYWHLRRLGFLTSAFVLFLDQISKWCAIQYFQSSLGQAIYAHQTSIERLPVKLLPILQLIPAWNRGISFGLFNQSPHIIYIISIVTIVLCVTLAVFILRGKNYLTTLAYGAILGGAVGNIIDRLRFGAVFDFIDLYYKHHHWYTFNIADAAISLGAVALILDNFFLQKSQEHSK